MPIQNVGTLLENLVVTEAASCLFTRCARSGETFEFVNSFAMPPLSPWSANAQNAGFDELTLDKLCESNDAIASTAGLYPRLLRRILKRNRDQGPNAALLVLGAWGEQECASPRLWLNDLRNGRYGNAIEPLAQIARTAETAGLVEAVRIGNLRISVCDTPYPEAVTELARFVTEVTVPRVRLAFLDPMRYRIDDRRGPETSSQDHRTWLRTISNHGPTVALHFTGNSHHPTLRRELATLFDDALSEGFLARCAFRRQHYAMFVAVHDQDHPKATLLLATLESHVQAAWKRWCAAFTTLHDHTLRVDFGDSTQLNIEADQY